MARLQALRIRKPLTQRELAEQANVSEATIRAIETGRGGRIRPRTMRAIAHVLGVEAGDVDEFRPTLGLEDDSKAAAA